MKKAVILTLLLAVFAFAEDFPDSSSTLVESCYGPAIPDSACTVVGTVCNQGFNVAGERSMLFFNIGSDATCSPLFKSSHLQTYKDSAHTEESPVTTFFLVEDENDATPLSLTLAGSLATAAALNGRCVSIIYKRVKLDAFGGIRLLSIRLFD